MTRPTTTAISPSFIVSNVDQTIAFYRDKLGFEVRFQEPGHDPFWASLRNWPFLRERRIDAYAPISNRLLDGR